MPASPRDTSLRSRSRSLALTARAGAPPRRRPTTRPPAPAPFAPYTAANGRPRDLQAIAELVEATPDPGVPRCLGAASFARTVWYRIPAVPARRR